MHKIGDVVVVAASPFGVNCLPDYMELGDRYVGEIGVVERINEYGYFVVKHAHAKRPGILTGDTVRFHYLSDELINLGALEHCNEQSNQNHAQSKRDMEA